MAATDYTPTIQQAAQSWNVDPTLLQALIEQESGYNPKATSKDGAVGLTQLMPGTAQAMGVTDPTDPTQQIYGGAKYLAQGLNAEKTPEAALNYYHGGPDWRNSYGPESAAYAPAVTARYTKLAQAAAPSTPTPAAASPADDPFTAAMKSAQAGSGAGPSAGADPFTAALTQAQKATAPVPIAPNPDAGLNEYGITDDPQQFNKPLTPAEQGVSNVGNAVIQGAKAGFGSGPIGMSPQTEQALVNAGVLNGPGEYNPLKVINHALIGGLAAGGDLAMRTGGALLGAYQGGVSQAGAEVGAPVLGRDLAALPQAFPTGDTAGGTGLPHPLSAAPASNPLVREISPAAHDALDAPLPAAFLDNPGVTQPSMVGQTEPNPLAVSSQTSTPLAAATAGGASVPQSVGAAASRDLSHPSVIGITPAQEQAYRATAEGQKLLEPQQPGIADPTVYVPGVTPNSAEIEQNVNTARELKSLNVTAPQVSQEAKEIAAANNDTRQQFFSSAAGSPVTVQNLREARANQFARDSEATLSSGTGDADTAPISETVQGILNSPTGKQNTELQTFVRPLLNRLQDADGVQKITDPAELIGFRQDVNRMLSKTSQAATPNLAHISDELRDIVGNTDDAIEQARPGYAQQRANYADYSRQIDEQNALQDFEPKLYGANNQMQYGRVQNMMRQIVDARSSPGINKYKAISDDSMQQLWNLRDDLRRSASAQELARAAGSDTVQNAWDAAKGHVKAGANLAAHGAILSHLGPIGNVAYNAVRGSIAAGAEGRALKRQTARGMEMLRPKTPLRNPLETR